ncbi:MAG: phosphatase PAP2 family protein [Legionella sp.]|uniref:phosphatase PAP2 family protein n=1 Tax=Legionella sp. TaxID=459 RepID=UPI0039E2891F
MRSLPSRYIILLSGLILFFSLFIFFINCMMYHYRGNNYFPDNVPLLALILVLFYLGLTLIFAKHSKPCLIGRELLYFFCIMSVIAFATNAIQLTPFTPIDKQITWLEKMVHIDMDRIVRWTNLYPRFKNFLGIIYDNLTYQMSIIPLLVILTCRFHLLREYYFLLLCTTLIGFSFYYFFPTTAPASMSNGAYFSTAQIATGLKFQQIHHHIIPTTNDGGLIALPSFHVIWAMLCVYLIREWKIACVLLAILNLFLIASCVLLGWHYPTDLIGSAIVLIISFYLLQKCKNNLG